MELSLQNVCAESGKAFDENGERLSLGPFGCDTVSGRKGRNSRWSIILLRSNDVCKSVKDNGDLVWMCAEMLAGERVKSRGNFSIRTLTDRLSLYQAD